MSDPRSFFDDIAKLAGGAVSSLSGLKNEIEILIRQQLEKMMSGMNLVHREEFEVLKEMVVKARLEQEKLQAEIEKLKNSQDEK